MSAGGETEQRVRFVAEPESVPIARRFVTDSVTGSGLGALAEDAALLVTELSANAALHSGSRYFDVVVQSSREAVMIGVVDQGPDAGVSARPSRLAMVGGRQQDFDPVEALELEATTGRGLVIVSALADRWGVDTTLDGKLVWGELSADARNQVDGEAQLSIPARTPDRTSTPDLPPDWVRVTMIDVPVDLARRHDEHLWELVRELQLISATVAEWPAEMAHLINDLVERHSGSWRLSEAMVDQAAAEGRDRVTLDLVMAASAADDVQRLKRALDVTDTLCRRSQLLTLAATPEVRRLRAWMESEIVQQVLHDAAPVPWGEYDD